VTDNKKTINVMSYIKLNWIELSLLFYVALFPFGEIMHVALIPLLFFSVYRLFDRDLYGQRWAKIYLLVSALLFVPIVLTSFFALVVDRHLEVLFQWFIYSAIGLVVADSFRTRMNEALLLYVVAALIMLAAFDGIMQFILGFNLLGNPMVEGRVTSFFYPRVRMTDLAYLSPFVFEAIRRYSLPGGARQFAWLLVVPLALSVFLGGSRTGWLVMFVVSALYIAFLLYRREFPVKMFFVACLASVLTIFVSIQLSPDVQRRVDKTMTAFSGKFEDINQASTNRVLIYEDALTSITEHPWFGVGRYGFKEVEFETRERVGDQHRQAHLMILDVPVNTGIIGLLGYLSVFGWLVVRVFRSAGQSNGMAYAMTVGVTVLIMPINTAYGFYDVRPSSLALIFLSMVFVYLPTKDAAETSGRISG